MVERGDVIAVISDVHADIALLDAVLADIDMRCGPGTPVWCLGDIVGYGKEPLECVDRVSERCEVVLKGNHDHWTAGYRPHHERERDEVGRGIARAHRELSVRDRMWLDSLPAMRMMPAAATSLPVLGVHASPRDPLMEFIGSYTTAAGILRADGFCGRLLFGHTHVPIAFLHRQRGSVTVRRREPGKILHLRAYQGWLLNPGAVSGGPGVPSGCWLELDRDVQWCRFHRVPTAR